MAGITVIFKRDGQQVGTALTDDNGVATFTEDNVPVGHWDTQVCVDKTQDVEPDHTGCLACAGHTDKCEHWHHNGASANAVVIPGDGGGDDNLLCTNCTVVVYHDCVQGKVSGKGMIDFPCDPDANGNPTMGMLSFNFRLTYDNGNFQGKVNVSDHVHPTIRDQDITWMVMDGADAWFGTDDWMIHIHDGGMPKPNMADYFEIYRWPFNFHAGENLMNCYVRSSFRYTYQCPTP